MTRLSRSATIVNLKGLHARASAKFVEVVEAHEARAAVAKDGMEVSGDSIMGLLMLGASRGTSIDVTTSAGRGWPPWTTLASTRERAPASATQRSAPSRLGWS